MKHKKIIHILLFALILGLPLALSLLNIRFETNSSENRQLIEAPEFSTTRMRKAKRVGHNVLGGLYRDIVAYKDSYNAYYEDNFIFKPQLFSGYRDIQTSIFDLSPIPEKVVFGKEGWYFLGDSFSKALSESKGIQSFSEVEMEQIHQKLVDQKTWLASKDIDYHIAIAPNKAEIYGDFLPISSKGNASKMNQIINSAPHEISILDLGSGFPKNSSELYYYKTDTHWNDIGAYWGYKSIMESIRKEYPEIKILSLTDFDIKQKTTTQNDLSKMLGIHINEIVPEVLPLSNDSERLSSTLTVPASYNIPQAGYEHRFKSNVNSLKILIFRDSFGTALMKYFKDSFGEVVFIQSYVLDKELIEKEKPDIVIQQLVSRNLDYLLD